MPPEVSAQTAVDPFAPTAMPLSGMVVLMLIPVVAYALWGDYFERYIARLRADREEFEEIEELYRVRLNGLFAVLAEAVIFLGSGSTRQEHPILGGALAFGTVVTLLFLQGRCERKVRREAREPGSVRGQIKDATRAFIWSLLAGVTYLTAFGGAIVLCTLPSLIFKLTGPLTVLLLLAGISSGVLGGLCASFALAPVFVRKIFGAERISDSTTVTALDQLFDSAKIERPGYWVVGLRQYHPASAMVAGFQSGRGIFRPGLFISKAALDALSPDELRAVVLHEVSHLRLRHLRKRFIFSSGLVICASLLTGMLVQIAQTAFHEPQLAGLVGCIALLGAFLVAFRCLAEQTRFQEVQADIHSIEKLGSRLEDLASALRKLDKINGVSPYRREPGAMMLSSGHPATELRIRILRKYFERFAAEKKNVPPEEDEKKIA